MTTRKAAPRTRTKAGQATKKTGGTRKRVTARTAALDARPVTVRTVQRTERGTYAPRQEPQERHPTAADYFAVGLVLLFVVLVGGGSTAREMLRSAVPAEFQTQPAPGGQP